jgi:cysteine-rich repeat protein
VAWDPPPWNSVGLEDAAQRTPDLSTIVQEIVDRPGWASGNAVAFIFTGSGVRTAESYEGLAAGAPLLHVAYALPGCGNGYLEPSEACDDGNLAPGDGCDGACQITRACSDSVDNDGDAHFDFPLDPGCQDPEDDSERSPDLFCDNGIDDDEDGGTDYAGDDDDDGISDPPGDLGCASPLSFSETPACQDGVDNDQALGTDFDGGASLNDGVPVDVADPHCSLPSDEAEGSPFMGAGGCGIGPELLALLLFSRFRRAWRRPRP